ncbi:spore-associated protein A [Saccharopolyspora sp. NPDC047091]|uniref:spore-associated protein A n=1 Tax=Saccharopolyspora sp. NPDC047091 TaxID=3155924 RepID=UPI0033DF8F72
MRPSRTTAAAGLVACAVTGGLLLGTAPAHAATYNGACGSGYSVVNQAQISGKGTVFLTYNASNETNCVVTVRNSPGAAVPIFAGISRQDDSTWYAVDQGDYTTYAGPVYRSAAGKCVTWGGAISGVYNGGIDTNCG